SRFTGVAAGAAGAAAFSAAGFSALFPHADTMSANTSTRLYACFVTAYPPALYFAELRRLLASYTLPTIPLEVPMTRRIFSSITCLVVLAAMCLSASAQQFNPSLFGEM